MKKNQDRVEILNLIENFKEAGDSISYREAEEIYENEVCFGEIERKEDMKDYYETSDGPKEVPAIVKAMESEGRIRVVLVKPMEAPEIVFIGSELKSFQQIVGGYIEEIMPFEEEVAIVCNEEGKLLKLELNRAIKDQNGEISDIVAGNFILCSASGENFGSFTDEQAHRYYELYKVPEVFVMTYSGIKTIPMF